MAEAEAKAAKEVIRVGKQLAAKHTCPNKDYLVKLLRQAASSLPKLRTQSGSLKPAIKPLSDSLLKHGLLQQKDKDVRLLVASCVCEILRILAPNPGFRDEDFKDIFQLLLGMFAELAHRKSPYFSRSVELLETVAKVNFCVLMLDTGSEDLVLRMFCTFFNVIRKDHSLKVFSAMSSIMSVIFQEKGSQELLEVVLQNLLKDEKDAAHDSFQLAVSVIQNCSRTLKPLVRQFLNSCILDRNHVNSELKESYHAIIFEIFQYAPEMLIAVVPNLAQELSVDIRIIATNFVGRLFSIPGRYVAQEYHHLFIEFLNRFCDKSAEVRLNAVLCAKQFYLTNPSEDESVAVLTALEDRLSDVADKVRAQAVAVVCDLAKSNLKPVPTQLVVQAAKRLRDKKASVRKKALQKLLEVYHNYCTRCSEGIINLSADFEQIPCGILMLCYDKESEFGPQNIEHVLAEDLFPVSLSVEDRMRHWIFLLSHSGSAHQKEIFNPVHEKALNVVLSQKSRLQIEMQSYLAFRTEEKDDVSGRVEKRVKQLFTNMSMCFPKKIKAEECFHKLHLVKDNDLFNMLMEILVEAKFEPARIIRDNFLKKIADMDSIVEFLGSLATKCSFNIFSYDHVRCLLDHLSEDDRGQTHSKNSCVTLLLIIISAFPLLLRGSEEQFCLLLLEEKFPFRNELLQMLVKAGPHISVDLSVIYPFLESICLNGTRSQSKLAISAIGELVVTSKQFSLPDLCKTLVDALKCGQNIPTVLQSLGCIAQHSVSVFEGQAEEITQYIVEHIFLVNEVGMSDDLVTSDDESRCSTSCKLKIFGLKALVKSFLPRQHTGVTRQIDELLGFISQMIQKGEVSDGTVSCETDKDYLRLAAATSVLRLSRMWDSQISPDIYRCTVLMAKDPSSLVRRLFLDKTFKLLKKNVLPIKYLCVFALAASDFLGGLQKDDLLNYMAEYIKKHHREAKVRQASAMQAEVTNDPVYSVMFLIHFLAHDADFPSQNCEYEEIHRSFFSPLVFTLEALINPSFVDGNMNQINHVVSVLHNIFDAINSAEDAINAHKTARLHVLANYGRKFLSRSKNSETCVSQKPTKIILPSSLYRKSDVERKQTLVDALRRWQDIPTVLESLGCIQHSVSVFGAQAEEITQYIVKHIFLVNEVGMSDDLVTSNDESRCSTSCKLKIFGLKALVKSFLSHRHTGVTRQIDELVGFISEMLQKGDVSDGTVSCETDKDNLRLAAATSVLRLSRMWDSQISPDIYRRTVLMAKDPSSLVRRLFLDKTFKLLKKNVLPSKYLCAFALAASDSLGGLQKDDLLNYMAEYIKKHHREAKVRQASAMQAEVTNDPVYSVMFLIHILAHDADFPSQNCEYEEIHHSFFSPLVFTLEALINPSFVDGNMNQINHVVSDLHNIFDAINRAEDAINAHKTARLHVLANYGSKFLSRSKNSETCVSPKPTKILLPSSLYRKSDVEWKQFARKDAKDSRKSVEDFSAADGRLPKKRKSLNAHKKKSYNTRNHVKSGGRENLDLTSPESITFHENPSIGQMEDSSSVVSFS